jgi:hypothetical protein
MEHIVRNLGKDELAEYIENGYEEDDLEDIAEEGTREESEEPNRYDSRASSRALSRGADVSPEMEARLYNGASGRNSKRFSNMSIIDVADRHLRDKTDAIAHIIRNISEQCAAAVEGLQLAHDADAEAEQISRQQRRLAAQKRHSNMSNVTASEDGDHSAHGSEVGDESLLRPNGRTSSIPPTPDLIHNRSSTSMSIASVTTTPERSSQQYTVGTDIPTKIVEDSDEERSDVEGGHVHAEPEMVTKAHHHESLIHRPSGARISALGGH